MFSAIFCANKQSHGDIEKMDACIQFSLCHYDAQRDRANVIREVLIRERICESKSDRANAIHEVLICAKYMHTRIHMRGRLYMREDIKLLLATEKDAELIHQMKYEAFLPLYEKYQDDETSPVKEQIEKVIKQLQEERTDYYLIQSQGEAVGAVRVRKGQEKEYYISPLFILPQYQNKGIAYAAIQLLFQIYKQAVVWRLDTILQEKGNCHLYEKCAFVRVGEEKIVNERMTLIDYEKH